MPVLCDNKRFLDFYADAALVSENTFIGCSVDSSTPPTFASVRSRLPDPHWEGERGAAAIACYWRTWEIAFSNLRPAKPGNGFVSPFIDTAFNGGCARCWQGVRAGQWAHAIRVAHAAASLHHSSSRGYTPPTTTPRLPLHVGQLLHPSRNPLR